MNLFVIQSPSPSVFARAMQLALSTQGTIFNLKANPTITLIDRALSSSLKCTRFREL